MGAIRIALFGGRVPKLEPHLLPDTGAQQAMNTKLTSGGLRPWWKPRAVDRIPFAKAKSVYRYMHDGVMKTLAFRVPTLVTESALVNDSHGRIYYSDASGYYVTTKADLAAGLPATRVGVPPPAFSTFRVHTQGGDARNSVSRVYVATLVTSYGEESAPGKTVTMVGNSDGVWQVLGLDTLITDFSANSKIELVRLYRTVSSGSGTDYRMVGEWPVGATPATFNDVKIDTEIASAFALSTLGWTAPPDGLRGVIAVSGGFNAGFFGRTVCFSVPYYPHAWPEDYQLRVDDDIVGIGFFDNTVVVLTEGPVHYAIGTTPDAMSLVRNAQVAPCLSAESIVSTTGAVLFASADGLYSVSSAGLANVTSAYVTRDEWSAMAPANLIGAVYEAQYVGFYSDSMGFALRFDDAMAGWSDVQHSGVTAVVTDRTTSRLLLAVDRDVVEWDGAPNSPMVYTWKSKPLLLPKPANFGALQLRGAFHLQDPTRPTEGAPGATDIDQPFGYNLFGVNDVTPVDGPQAANNFNPVLRSVYVRVYGDRQLLWSGRISSEEPERLPADGKFHMWELEVIGSVPLKSVALGTTFKALEETP